MFNPLRVFAQEARRRLVEVAEVFERNRRHSYLIFLGWYFNHGHVLVSFKEIFDADDVWNFALDIDGEADRDKALQLYFQESLNDIILSVWRNLNCNFYLSSFLLSNFKSNLFKIFKSFIASN